MTRRWRSPALLLGPVVVLLAASLSATPGSLAGGLGTDTSLPLTDSAVTVHGRGNFADLTITVNQTKQLTDQAVSLTWTGGKPTIQGPGRFAGNYLQIMQCWGDDDGSVPGNPGPPPEQCEQGAVNGIYGGLTSSVFSNGIPLSRQISDRFWPNFDPSAGYYDEQTGVWMPFRAVDGTVVNIPFDPNFNPFVQGGNFWLNPYFNIITTNEIAGSASDADGKGADLMEVLTGVQSTGLGCGQKVQPVAGGGTKVPKCWIVVVPRGTAAEEDVGTPYAANPDQNGVATSPLSPLAWKNRIAIPIEFNPVDSPCSLQRDQTRISGSELALPAVASWQPALCADGSLNPFAYSPVSDDSARQQLISGTTGGPGLVVSSKPLAAEAADPANPVVYAPLSLSGIVIGFNIERKPSPAAPSDEQQLAGVRVAQLHLTPRLVAKLLTQSYREAVDIITAPSYPWLTKNPSDLTSDPDFQRFNPEFQQLQVGDARSLSSLQLPEGNSDAAAQVWSWIFADPEAAAWLAGAADEWGMKVNPVYATTAAANSTGEAFGNPVPNSFPKSDPYCYQGPAQGVNDSILPPLLCGTAWTPYAQDMAETAARARSGFDGAKIVLNPNAISTSDVWKSVIPQTLGERGMISLTDTPSASRLGLQVASLARAGDDGDARSFVAPDAAGLTAGAAAMEAITEPTVLEPKPLKAAPGAYPLTALTYAAIAPLQLIAADRSAYAAFLDYAAGPGQVSGFDPGRLPIGYVPLPTALKAQTSAAADKVRTLQPTPTTTTTTTVPTTQPVYVPPVTYPTYTTPEDTTPPAESVPSETTTTVVSATTTTTVDGDGTPTSTTTAVTTPDVAPRGGGRYAVLGLGIVTLGSGLGALEITKRPRRRQGPPPSDPSGGG